MPLTILIADDHRFLAQSLQAILNPDFETVGIASNGRELIELAGRLKPNLIVTDLSMPVMNGLDAIRNLAQAGLPCKYVILTMHMDVSLAVEAFRAGASAFVLKTASHDELLEALHAVCAGGCYLSPHFPCDLVTLLAEAARRPPARPRAELTRRQVEVLRLVAEGKTMKQIAIHLGISVRTVESCKYQLMKLLAIRTTAELVHYAIEIGVIPIHPLDTPA